MTTTTLRKAKATAQREAKIQTALSTMYIDQDIFGAFAVFQSQSKAYEVQSVVIDESGDVPVAIRCTCDGYRHGSYCYHMESVDRFYQRVHTILHPVVTMTTVEEAMEQAQAEMEQYIEQAAAESEALAEKRMAEQRIGNFYEQRAQDFAYGCCGHIVFPERSGQLCGACLCK